MLLANVHAALMLCEGANNTWLMEWSAAFIVAKQGTSFQPSNTLFIPDTPDSKEEIRDPSTSQPQ